MASGSLFSKIAKFASSPQGQRAISKAKEYVNDPKRQQQAKDTVSKLRDKATGKGKGTGGSTGGTGGGSSH